VKRAVRIAMIAAGVCVSVIARLPAQGLAVEVSAGRIVYDPLSASLGTGNLMGTVRFDSARGPWVYGSTAVPLRDGDPAWAAFGASGRLSPDAMKSRRVSAGIEAGAHAFLFRDTTVSMNGTGAAIDAIPFLSVPIGAAQLEARAGWRGQTLSYGAATGIRRGVFETGGRVTAGQRVRLQGDVRWVHASEGTFPFAGATVVYGPTRLQLWGQAGKWLSDTLDEAAWAAGTSIPIGGRATLWAAVRQDPPDPLYWYVTRRTWNVGITRRLGRSPSPLQPASRADDGGVWIRISHDEAHGGSMTVAGDFNNWSPVAMQRDGSDWAIRLQLAPGVYHYAFKSGRGEWFVPPSVAGRRDDGMGGYVAVLVVV
jgi:hypothetical protein